MDNTCGHRSTNKMQTNISLCFTPICGEDTKDPMVKSPPFVKTNPIAGEHYRGWIPSRRCFPVPMRTQPIWRKEAKKKKKKKKKSCSNYPQTKCGPGYLRERPFLPKSRGFADGTKGLPSFWPRRLTASFL